MKKIYSYDSMRMTAFIGGTPALALFALMNYRVFKPYAKNADDVKKLNINLFLSVLGISILFIPIPAKLLLITINVLVCTMLALLWKNLNEQYVEQGGEYVTPGKSFAISVSIAIIILFAFVGINYFNGKKQNNGYRVIDALIGSFDDRFNDTEYNSYYEKYVSHGEKAIVALDSYAQTGDTKFLDSAEEDWKEAMLYLDQMSSVEGIPGYLSKNLPMSKKFIDLRIVQIQLLRQYHDTPTEALSLRLDANLQLIDETVSGIK